LIKHSALTILNPTPQLPFYDAFQAIFITTGDKKLNNGLFFYIDGANMRVLRTKG